MISKLKIFLLDKKYVYILKFIYSTIQTLYDSNKKLNN